MTSSWLSALVAETAPAIAPAARGAIPSATGTRLRLAERRPQVRGKFLYVGSQKLYSCGVTYGAFQADSDGNEYHDLDKIDRDFAQMAASGLNTVRIPHTSPPVSLLDAALRHGLRVMVGLSCEQYVGYLIDRKGAPNVEAIVRDKVRRLDEHPALLCYALGNEIPASIVRWVSPQRIERYLERLYHVVKEEDPEGIVTYVNYPTTEYLRLPFLDLLAFNVYLEHDERLAAYIERLHHLAGDRPILMSEVGLDSMSNGEEAQRTSLERQLRTTFASGCAGAFVFAWTDEWYRGGGEVDDWAFGLTDKDRKPKPALSAVSNAFREAPFASDIDWPPMSVVVCAYNAGATMRDCLDGISELEYPNYEVIVVDDGSSDDTATIAAEYPCKLISTENRGLSAARNAGLEASTGAIVAYLDSDARPDPHWLQYLARSFASGEFAGVGGPNIAPTDDGEIATAVAHSPGGPVHVMLSDRVAEHLPGCNMAFRRADLLAIGGFDPRFRIAGDDVDACWRIQELGGQLGFSPAAVVWHHRRHSIRAYWRQQRHYGIAERLLEQKWPEKYNSAGHISWSGRLYGGGLVRPLMRVYRVYHGLWGSAPFQRLYEREPHSFWALAAMPEWWLVIAALSVLAALGAVWSPLLLVLPLVAAGVGVVVAQAIIAARCEFARAPLRLRGLVALLHILQPIARMRGRLVRPPVEKRTFPARRLPRSRRHAIWTECWEEPSRPLERIRDGLADSRSMVFVGSEYDRWDLEVRPGLFGAARLVMAVEDHGSGTQYFRFRTWPQLSRRVLAAAALLLSVAIVAAFSGGLAAAVPLAAMAALLTWSVARQTSAAMGQLLAAIDGAVASAE